MALAPKSIAQIILPKRRGNDKGTAITSTFDPQNPSQVLTTPTYRDHLDDIFDTRQANDSRELLESLFHHDPDASAAVSAYLTVANTDPVFTVYDENNEIDREGHVQLAQILSALTQRFDYSKGFLLKPNLRTICESFRYMLLLRGGIGSELVMDKTLVPIEIRNVDLASVDWYEEQAGKYRPVQTTSSGDEIDLNIPTFFVSFYHRDPTKIYAYSPFVSAINTIAARQQVINDLYRIMQLTGYPRMELTIVEDVLRKNAPADVRADESKMKTWLANRLTEVSGSVTNLRADQAFVHFDSVETGIMNSEGPKQALDARAVIEVLNSSNQSALKTMATIIGRGESGVNTASVEASVFAKNAEELNYPIAEMLSQMLTLALRLQGSTSRVEVKFQKVDLRPELELEPQRVMRQSRLLEALSYGVITDDEFHIKVFNRHRPDSVPELSGTGFYGGSNEIDVSDTSANSDPMGRSLQPEGSNSARSNQSKK